MPDYVTCKLKKGPKCWKLSKFLPTSQALLLPVSLIHSEQRGTPTYGQLLPFWSTLPTSQFLQALPRSVGSQGAGDGIALGSLSTRLEEGFLCYFTQEQPRPITAPYTSVMGSVRILILMPIGSPLGKKGHCACHKYYFSLGLTHSKQSWSCLSLQPDQTICRTLGMNWR